MDSCLFCKLALHEIPSTTLFEDERTVVFLDINPVRPGHALVISKAHAPDLLASSREDLHAVMDTVQKIAPAVVQATGALGCNVTANVGAAAGQVIFHTHLHIIPRHEEDGLAPWPHESATSEQREALGEQIRRLL
ncbi:HIT family protein [Candidatus Uhrbacteria bacterium]|nr:HIT family protein [Candidatus Uhrbacteria bacterium]